MNANAALNLKLSRPALADSPTSAQTAAPLSVAFKGGGLLLLTIMGMAAAALASPLVAEGWEFNRAAILNGEWSRMLTGHLTHWNLDHFLWDAVVLLGSGVACICRSVGRTVATLLVAAIAISGAILLVQPEVATYRGLSGLDSALFMLLAATLWRESRGNGRRGLGGIALVAALAFLAKAGYEAATGATLFVDSANAAFIPLASAHLVGGAVGWLIGIAPQRNR